ncbi:MAG: hypothetical protein MCS20_01065, partial [Candidatus Phytoplasma mali]|nr:hypothetical protein [Candidatus Phytoplasma australiense]MCG7201990.1 hypothetical protein [Candidatus Phytoplasma mali]
MYILHVTPVCSLLIESYHLYLSFEIYIYIYIYIYPMSCCTENSSMRSLNMFHSDIDQSWFLGKVVVNNRED